MSRLRPVIDLDKIARDIAARPDRHLPTPIDYAPIHARVEPLPAYVTHAEDIGELGALSAEAVVREYEAAAKEVEAMGEELTKVVSRCEEIKANSMRAMEAAKATAAAYREEAKRQFDLIEAQSLLVAEVSSTCDALRKRITKETMTA